MSTPTDSSRTAICDEAVRLFAEHGFDGTTVEMIASAAGVNKAMISYHFGGKEKLYAAILDAVFEAASERLAAVRDAEAPADEKLARYIRVFAELQAQRPQFSALVLREVLSGGARLHERVRPRFLQIFESIRAIVAQGIREGRFRTVNPLLTHLGVIGTLVFFFGTEPFRRRLVESGLPIPMPTTDEFIAHLTGNTLRGLRPDSTQAPGKENA